MMFEKSRALYSARRRQVVQTATRLSFLFVRVPKTLEDQGIKGRVKERSVLQGFCRVVTLPSEILCLCREVVVGDYCQQGRVKLSSLEGGEAIYLVTVETEKVEYVGIEEIVT